MMEQPLIFSRAKLADYLACQRRFQLRFVQQRSWPVAPLPGHVEESLFLGQQFHLRLQRYFMGLPLSDETDDNNPQLQTWWQCFLDQGPILPAGRRYAELSLTVPIGRHQLAGRFDLLIFGKGKAHIFDWKTDAHPRPAGKLGQDLQTRLYLALIVEGSGALSEPITTEQVQLTYWFVNDPAATVTISYSQIQHERNWADLLDLITEIESQIANQDAWELTESLKQCQRCAYQALCGRPAAVQDLSSWLAEGNEVQLEPDLP